MDYNRVWAEINLDNIRDNLEAMHQNLPKETKIMAVVKTDAYGHGAVEIAHMLESVDYVFGYAAATVDEAMELRKHRIKKPILVLGFTFPEEYSLMIENDIRPTIFRYDMAKEFSDAAVALNKTAPVHIKIDTGMGRIGFLANEASVEEIKKISKLPNIEFEGIFTHFARSDEKDKSHAEEQLRLFNQMIDALSKDGVHFQIHHCANSAAILELPDASMDMVRAGITLYGLWPSEEMNRSFPLKPALSLYSRIVHIKELPAGCPVSYGGTFVTKAPTRVATIPVGYGDGYSRGLSNRGFVLIHGKKAPILGRVCMDQMMVDVTSIPEAKLMDKVTLVGRDEDQAISLEELGDLSGRFNYEFACCLGNRIPRIYYLNGKEVARKHYFE
ncbi:MAG: alanine racemase [Lachnospiraceae bacterium]|nr:alanine racemase [Lachnospiraceae bacterium]